MFANGIGYQAYQTTAIEARAASADIHRLVLMLFEGFLEELARFEGHIAAKRFEKKADAVARLLKILGGLEASLNPETGGDVAVDMMRLYKHCGEAVMQASLQNELGYISNVREVMTNLHDGWLNVGKAQG
jgi:flagellar secretion chaperone FliS